MPEHSEITGQIVEQLTLEEKAWLVSGGGNLCNARVDGEISVDKLPV